MFNQSSSTTEESSTDDAAIQTPLRKRKVKEDTSAKATRINDQRRVQNSQRDRALMIRKLQIQGVRNDDPDHQAVSFQEPVIYLHPFIGGRIRPHQLAGVQFMWRELITDKNRQGCLLAHTMGLGKTMQV